MRALGRKDRNTIEQATLRVDPDGDYVQLDISQQVVQYTGGITCHEHISAAARRNSPFGYESRNTPLIGTDDDKLVNDVRRPVHSGY